jgi:hypothetical protein
MQKTSIFTPTVPDIHIAQEASSSFATAERFGPGLDIDC